MGYREEVLKRIYEMFRWVCLALLLIWASMALLSGLGRLLLLTAAVVVAALVVRDATRHP